MSINSPIDLSLLPAPDVVEALDYEAILQQRRAYLISLWPVEEQGEITQRLALDSDPLTKLLQESAYRELLLRQRINDAARAVMLAYAGGADLDQIAARFDVQRLIVTLPNPKATPPIPAVYESDERFRARVQMALEGITTAGTVNSYTYHALSASARVKDVGITRPVPGTVRISVLSIDGQGLATSDLLATVAAALNAEYVRPLCDTVDVVTASVVPYSVDATLRFYSGPGSEVVTAVAEAALRKFANDHHRLGHDITLSGIHAALHQIGVQNVLIASPAADLVIDPSQAAYCTGITLRNGGIYE